MNRCPYCQARVNPLRFLWVTRWTPTDVLQQMQREVRRHYAQYWAQYRNAIRQHARGAPHVPSR
jgi:hypothetical protein